MRNALSLFLFAALAGIPVPAVSASIGVATSLATYSINEKPTAGAAELADGAKITTTTAPNEMRLANGTEIRLATRSSGEVYSDHLVLKSGSAWVSRFADYSVHAGNLRVSAESGNAQAVVRLHDKRVEVASLGGPVTVTDGGIGMTRIATGTRMSFQTAQDQTSADASTNKPIPQPRDENRHALIWTLVTVSAAAIIIGSIAAAQGKSPF